MIHLEIINNIFSMRFLHDLEKFDPNLLFSLTKNPCKKIPFFTEIFLGEN